LEAVAPLSVERLALVEALFATWDFADAGKINLAQLSARGLELGPHDVDLFSVRTFIYTYIYI